LFSRGNKTHAEMQQYFLDKQFEAAVEEGEEYRQMLQRYGSELGVFVLHLSNFQVCKERWEKLEKECVRVHAPIIRNLVLTTLAKRFAYRIPQIDEMRDLWNKMDEQQSLAQRVLEQMEVVDAASQPYDIETLFVMPASARLSTPYIEHLVSKMQLPSHVTFEARYGNDCKIIFEW